MSGRDLGIIGLGVMGRNLALNAGDKGFSVAGFDTDAEKGKRLMDEKGARPLITANSMHDFTEALERPRRILMMVPAGKPVDAVLEGLKPHIVANDIVIDGGNSYYKDTERRVKELEGSGYRFFGMGVSGGEEGALRGPSLMPGGHEPSYRTLEPILTRMAAQTSDGACCAYMGPGGAGHYVKMVHNGIEYGVMQLLCEVYDIFKSILGLKPARIREIFAEWNDSELNSFLLEITVTVLGKIDPQTREPLVELILDEAEQKGTGKWTAQDALDLGVGIPTLTASVMSRVLSGAREERLAAAKVLSGPKRDFTGDSSRFIASLRQAYYVSAVACYAQGCAQLRAASRQYQYGLKLAEIARIWKGGCIIRAKMLDPISAAFRALPDLENLMLDPYFTTLVNQNVDGLRQVVQTAADLGTPCLAMSSTLGYIDSYRQKRLPANLLQAMRDYFGAHTYHRIDQGGTFHTEWNK